MVIIIKLISVHLPESYLNILEVLVAEGKFPNRSEAIRVGIRDLIKTEFLIEKSINLYYDQELLEAELQNNI
ncbi:MAG: ribbon-helix-helix domain-containing protein [Promethearchaeota archaeon]